MQKLRHLWVLVKGGEAFVDVAGLDRTHAQLKIAGQIQYLFDERMKTRAVIVVPADIYTRQHEFAETGIDEFTRRIKRVLVRRVRRRGRVPAVFYSSCSFCCSRLES